MIRAFRTVINKNKIFLNRKFNTNNKEEFNEEKEFKDDNNEEEEEEHFNPTKLIFKILKLGLFCNIGYNFYQIAYNKEESDDEEVTRYDTYYPCKWVYNKYSESKKVFFHPPLDKFLRNNLLNRKLLILNFNDTLIKKDVSLGKGMEIYIRPGLKEFLAKMSQKYEIVFFGDEDSMTLDDMIRRLKVEAMVMNSFGKEFYVLHKGSFIKNLDYFNRNLKDIILVDRNFDIAPFHKENTIVIPDFDLENTNDKSLKKLEILLDHMVMDNVNDVRKELTLLGDDPVERYYQQILTKYNSKNKNYFSSLLKNNNSSTIIN